MKKVLTITVLILCGLSINVKAKADYGLGLIPSDAAIASQYRANGHVLDVPLPSSVDLSTWLPSIGDQRGQASCVGWSLAYYYKTCQENRERGWGTSIPEHRFSPSWVYNQRAIHDREGMTLPEGFDILLKGAASEAMFSYDPNDSHTQPSQRICNLSVPYRIIDYRNVFHGRGTANLERLKALLASGEPFALAVPVYDSFFAKPENVPKHTLGEQLYGYHSLLVVGYDDGSQTFKAANSWGLNWGVEGYVFLSYDFVRHDAIEAWTMQDHIVSCQTWLPIVVSYE